MSPQSYKRKLAAILSADVKGYSRLMSEDEAHTIGTLTEYRDLMSILIRKHRGRVVDSPGDNLLAEFASVIDAVQCALSAIPLADRASIAVLPFKNLSGDPEQEYFSDGITNDIITDLSKFRELLVIASNTVFTYKGKSVKIKDVSRELGVSYVMKGSVQKAGAKRCALMPNSSTQLLSITSGPSALRGI